MNYTLITGASSGIGYELACVYAKNNHNLILVARSEDKLLLLKEELEKSYKVQIEVMPCDLSVAGSALKLFDKVNHKKMHVEKLINNAGFGDHGLFFTADIKKVSEMIQLNVLTLTELTRLFLPAMVHNKSGQILNVASTASFQPGPLMSVYYATKAYVLFFSEGLYEELQGTGVTVTALCPGPTESGFQAVANLKNVPLVTVMKLPTSREVAEFGYKAAEKENAVAVHGFLNKLMTMSVGLFPRSLIRRLVMNIQKNRT